MILTNLISAGLLLLLMKRIPITSKNTTSFEEKIKEFEKSMDFGDVEAMAKINTEFHDLLYGLSKSTKLLKLIDMVRDQILRYRSLILRIEGESKISNEHHRLMLTLIRKQNIDGVERVVKKHILRGKNLVINDFLKENQEL